MKFRKKPVVIEAAQWNGNVDEIPEFIMNQCYLDREYLCVKTLEGTMVASIGDWIIQGVKGEIYPCKPDIFEATYEAVDD
jgi:hypothetical protein